MHWVFGVSWFASQDCGVVRLSFAGASITLPSAGKWLGNFRFNPWHWCREGGRGWRKKEALGGRGKRAWMESWEPELQPAPLRWAPRFCSLGGYQLARLGCRVWPGVHQQETCAFTPSFLTRVTLVRHLSLLRTGQGGAVRGTGGGGESYFYPSLRSIALPSFQTIVIITKVNKRWPLLIPAVVGPLTLCE